MRSAWRVWLPSALLLVVAASQIALVRVAALTPWKGGGFGMFSTNDGAAFRFVRLFVEAPERSEELQITESLDDPAARAPLFPSDRMLAHLADAAAARERRRGRPVSVIRVEVWKTEFEKASLRAAERRIGALAMRFDSTPPGSR